MVFLFKIVLKTYEQSKSRKKDNPISLHKIGKTYIFK